MTMSGTTTFLDGNYAPVTEELTATDLPVSGTIPSELTGRFARIGPNPLTPPDPATYHWFLGTGMVHGVRLDGGRAHWYRNRSVHDVVNTHVIGLDGRTFALVEAGSQPVELTYELDPVGPCDLDGTLTGSFSAHTHRDPATGDLHAVTYHWSWDHIRHVVVGPDARVRREVSVPVPDGPMVHDCAITERHVLLFDLPCTFDLDAVAAGASFPYRWNPDHPPRVGLLPLDGGPEDVRWFEAPSCYVFHTLNAYDAGGAVVVDLVRHPRVFATVLNGPSEGTTTLERWTLDLEGGRLTTEVLDDRGVEFPRLDERRVGRAHRYGYAAVFGSGAAHGQTTTKHDMATGRVEVHDHGPGRAALEPVFVPRDGASAEDDGWVLTYVYDAGTDRSDVVILAAQDLGGDPVATVHLPARVPFGFHGSWIPDES
ncbi:MAG: carotenoid oxygenase family protein [Acidimicrobiia bacterium]